MLKMTVRKARSKDGYARCSNVKCRAVIEPPIAQLSFQLGMDKKVYHMDFCCNCADKISRAGDAVAMRVLD